jgi:protein phosphatase
MSRSEPQLYCVNPACARPQPRIETTVCTDCGTVLPHRYLWAVGEVAAQTPAGTCLEQGRFYVVQPQVWLDLKPRDLPPRPTPLPETCLPYLYLYPHRLHLPNLYGVCPTPSGELVLLLDNAPIDPQGQLLPSIDAVWPQANALRQLYWLWQMLQLWQPLHQWGMVGALLETSMIRVQDWRIRLQQLQPSHPALSLADLAAIWKMWVPKAQPSIAGPLQQLCQHMQREQSSFDEIAHQLNQLLLQQAAQLPLRLHTVGITDTGPSRSHNEDACYPVGQAVVPDDVAARLSIVCDGIAGHEGGEVASQLAVQLIPPQIQAFLTEIAEQSEILSPALIREQLAAIARVVNNTLSSQNDAQAREARRRMGTTLVMALQVPQRVKLPTGIVAENSHELYLLNVGDSRAYWLTPQACHTLTVDDDVATREVKMGRSLYQEALQRPDAGSLTQALGTREGDYLRTTVQRFILEEDGLLLLCSDGLSDHSLVEQSWLTFTEPVLQERLSLEEAAAAWVKLANEKNGIDNVSLVLTRVQVSLPQPGISFSMDAGERLEIQAGDLVGTGESLVASAQPRTQRPQRSFSRGAIWLLLIALIGTSVGVGAWAILDPQGFAQMRHRVEMQLQQWGRSLRQ